MIVDTDVLIWYMRGDANAYKMITDYPGFSFSVVTYIELVQGMRNKQEFREFRKAMTQWKARILPINEAISEQAQGYVEAYFLSHALELADALIAATATSYGLPILTANDKHYRMIPNISIKIFRPSEKIRSANKE